MAKKFKSADATKQAKNFRVLHGEPIIFPYNPPPPEENPLPYENAAWPKFFLIGGSILALLCAWWFFPAQTNAVWKNLVRQIFQFGR